MNMESQELRCFICNDSNAIIVCMCQIEPVFLCRQCLEPHRKEKSCSAQPISLLKIRKFSEAEQDTDLGDKHLSKKFEIYYELFKRREAVLESQKKVDNFKDIVLRNLETRLNERYDTYKRILSSISKCFHDFHEMSYSRQTEKFILQYEAFKQIGLRGLSIEDSPSISFNEQELQDLIENAFSYNPQKARAQDITENMQELTAAIQEKDATILDIRTQLDNIQHEYSTRKEELLRSISEKDEIIQRLENQLKAFEQEVAPSYELFHPYSLIGHSGHIYSVCISQDGKWAVSASRDKTAKIWNLDNKSEEGTLTGHTKSIYSVCMSNDSRYIITGSEDNSIRIWNFNDRSLETILNGHTGTVYSVCMSLDGAWIISGSGDKTVKIWNFQNRSEEATLTGHTNYVSSVCISQDGKWIISGGCDNSIIIWNFESKIQECRLKGHTAYVFSAYISADGAWIISGSADKTIRIWNFYTKTQEVVLEGHTNAVCSVCMSIDGRWIVSGSYDGSIRVWSFHKNAQEAVFAENTGTIYSVAINGDGRRIISGSVDKSVQIWGQNL